MGITVSILQMKKVVVQGIVAFPSIRIQDMLEKAACCGQIIWIWILLLLFILIFTFIIIF